MNHTEAAQLVSIMAAAHRVEVTDDLMEVWWRAALERVDYQTGLDAAMHLVETSEFMPRPASFNQAVTQLRLRAARENVPALGTSSAGELPRPASSVVEDQQRRFTSMWREALAESAAKGQHNHNPGPCRVCGGCAPTR